MGETRRVLEIGLVTVEVPAVASVRVLGGSRFVAWSAEDLLTVSIGRYSASVNDRGMLVIRKYEEPPK